MKELEIKSTTVQNYKVDERGEFVMENGKKVPDGEPLSLTVTRMIPETMKEARTLWGDEQCYEMLMSEFKVRLQGMMRRGLSIGAAEADIVKSVQEWVPGQKPEIKKDLVTSFRTYFASLSPEEKARIAADLQAK